MYSGIDAFFGIELQLFAIGLLLVRAKLTFPGKQPTNVDIGRIRSSLGTLLQADASQAHGIDSETVVAGKALIVIES